MAELKRISRIESIGKHGVTIEVHVATERELSSDETYEISDIVHKMINSIRKNSFLLSEDTQQEIKEEKEKLLALFDCPIYVKEIPSEYNDWIYPWFLVYTHKGPIKIGWRKRVINIDWTDSDIKYYGTDLFPNEDVTKSGPWDKTKYIHAWGYEKAKEYIDKLLKS